MAATPPLQLRSATTPLTPLHGPIFDQSTHGQRYSTRSNKRRATDELRSTPESTALSIQIGRTIGTPRRGSPSSEPRHQHSYPPQSSSKRYSNRRVEILLPSSPDFTSPGLAPFPKSASHPHFLSTTTILSEGMLPTPIKTPRKKKEPTLKVAARALFQNQPSSGDEVMATTKRGRRGKRHNGFTMEHFSTEDDSARAQIHIFTDSRDKVPQADAAEDNPFLDQLTNRGPPIIKKVTATSKRRKITGERKIDPLVDEALKNDEGMVYVL